MKPPNRQDKLTIFNKNGLIKNRIWWKLTKIGANFNIITVIKGIKQWKYFNNSKPVIEDK